jgi:dihydrofolate reductase
VVAMGGGAAQALVGARELDEIELHVVPVLLGRGRRLFEDLPDERVELELIRCLTPQAENREQQVTHLRYRVVR